VEWNPNAALVVMDFLLPGSKHWFEEISTGGSGNAPQGVQIERYWRRAVNESIDPGDVRDQVVIRDQLDWLETPSIDAELIVQLCKSEAYSDLWEHLGSNILASQPERILLICEQTLARIMRLHGAASSHDSQGFVATWRFANQRVSPGPENREWLQARIAEAASVSLELVNGLWHYFCSSKQYSLLRREDAGAVRQFECDTLRSILNGGEMLAQVVDARHPWTLYHLVFDPGEREPLGIEEISTWLWLGPICLDALRHERPGVAVSLAHLLAAPESGPRLERWRVNQEVLFAFFPSDAEEVAIRLIELSGRVADGEQQRAVRQIGETSRTVIHERNAGNVSN
jgi:hypothetical protein